MSDPSNALRHQDEACVPQDDLEQELYAALRAAGASPEQARLCLGEGSPEAGVDATA
jgi:hypothetical protein